jgi:D-glycero-D-manno-heptose 1,7-bisphosphate phosphatase
VNVLDQIVSTAYQENPILGALLGVLLDGGRVITTGEMTESLGNMVPDVFFLERREFEDIQFLSQLSVRDLVFVEKKTVDELWRLGHYCAAQIACVGDKFLDETLADLYVTEAQVRSAVLGLGPLLAKAQAARYPLEGPLENKALFLDRDGVLIDNVDYLSNPDQVRIRPQVLDGLKQARERGYRLIVITNQSGIGRQLISWDDYDKVTLKIQELFCKEGVFFDRILRAPFYDKSTLAHSLIRPSLRKPRPGMIHSIVSELRIDLGQSILVGDSATDLMAGCLAGVGKVYLFDSPGREEQLKKWQAWPLISRTNVGLQVTQIKSLKEIFRS